MQVTHIAAVAALGALGYFILAPGHPALPGEKTAATKAPTNNRSLLTSLKRQLAEEEEALSRSVYNHATTAADVTKGTSSRSPENRARAARIAQLRNRIAQLE
jgi:hypothetical protein